MKNKGESYKYFFVPDDFQPKEIFNSFDLDKERILLVLFTPPNILKILSEIENKSDAILILFLTLPQYIQFSKSIEDQMLTEFNKSQFQFFVQLDEGEEAELENNAMGFYWNSSDLSRNIYNVTQTLRCLFHKIILSRRVSDYIVKSFQLVSDNQVITQQNDLIQKLNHELEMKSMVDLSTGLYNKKYLESILSILCNSNNKMLNFAKKIRELNPEFLTENRYHEFYDLFRKEYGTLVLVIHVRNAEAIVDQYSMKILDQLMKTIAMIVFKTILTIRINQYDNPIIRYSPNQLGLLLNCNFGLQSEKIIQHLYDALHHQVRIPDISAEVFPEIQIFYTGLNPEDENPLSIMEKLDRIKDPEEKHIIYLE